MVKRVEWLDLQFITILCLSFCDAAGSANVCVLEYTQYPNRKSLAPNAQTRLYENILFTIIHVYICTIYRTIEQAISNGDYLQGFCMLLRAIVRDYKCKA